MPSDLTKEQKKLLMDGAAESAEAQLRRLTVLTASRHSRRASGGSRDGSYGATLPPPPPSSSVGSEPTGTEVAPAASSSTGSADDVALQRLRRCADVAGLQAALLEYGNEATASHAAAVRLAANGSRTAAAARGEGLVRISSFAKSPPASSASTDTDEVGTTKC